MTTRSEHVEVCTSDGVCREHVTETVTLVFPADACWAALSIAAREAGVSVGLLLETYVRAGLSLAGYDLEIAA